MHMNALATEVDTKMRQRHYKKKKNSYGPVSLIVLRHKNQQQNISILYSPIDKKETTSQTSGVYPRNAVFVDWNSQYC